MRSENGIFKSLDHNIQGFFIRSNFESICEWNIEISKDPVISIFIGTNTVFLFIITGIEMNGSPLTECEWEH